MLVFINISVFADQIIINERTINLTSEEDTYLVSLSKQDDLSVKVVCDDCLSSNYEVNEQEVLVTLVKSAEKSNVYHINLAYYVDEKPYLLNLKINDYDLSPLFDKQNNLYSVNIENNTSKLNIEYEKTDNTDILILGNDNLMHLSNIYLVLYQNNQFNTYQIIVNKSNDEKVTAIIDDDATDLTVKSLKKDDRMIIVIGAASLTFIIMLGIILFRKKK